MRANEKSEISAEDFLSKAVKVHLPEDHVNLAPTDSNIFLEFNNFCNANVTSKYVNFETELRF